MSNPVAHDPVAEAIKTLAVHVKYLGNGNAASEMGAIEFLATKIEEAASCIAEAIGDLAASNAEIAAAITELTGSQSNDGKTER